jgi:acyl-CoA thioester hydrolase
MSAVAKSEHTLHRRVHFYEVDSAGIVHFSVYFRYMEEAEHALWREAGLSIAPSSAGIGFPRVAAAFEYHRPLRFEDEFDVHLRVVAIADKSMQYSCTLTKGPETIATGSATIVCVEKPEGSPMRARSLPADVAGRFRVWTETGV